MRRTSADDMVDVTLPQPLSGRVALVTGGSRGIGRAVAERLASEGADVVINYHLPEQEDEALTVVSSLERAGVRSLAVKADVSSRSDVVAAVRQIEESLGPVSVLVNNAAATQVHCDWLEMSDDDWDGVMAVNARGALLCAQAVAPSMSRAGWGRIINVSSVTFFLGRPDLVHYVSSKGAVVGLTRSLARALGPDGVTVNAVSPGAILTEMELEVHGHEQEELAKSLFDLQAVHRRGVPEDIAGVVAFLAGDEASFITGQLINVDGGWVMH